MEPTRIRLTIPDAIDPPLVLGASDELLRHIEDSYEAWDTGASGFMLKPLTIEGVREQMSHLRYPIMGFG